MSKIKKRQLGEVITIAYCRDLSGQYWWIEIPLMRRRRPAARFAPSARR